MAVLVLDLEIDFAGLAVAMQGRDQFAERLGLGGKHRTERGEGDGAAVGVKVVAEIEMPGKFAAEDRLRFGQGLLDERVPDARRAAERRPPPSSRRRRHGWNAGRKRWWRLLLGGFCRKSRASSAVMMSQPIVFCVFVQKHAAVGVAVEADAEVRLFLGDAALSISRFGSTSGLGSWMKLPVISKRRGMMSSLDLVVEDGRNHFAGHAVAAIDDDVQRPLELEELQHVLAIVGPRGPAVGACRQSGLTGPERAGDAFDVVQPAGRADGLGLGSADFEAVVLHGIVRGGRLDSADGVEVVDGEIDDRCVDHAHVDDVHTHAADSIDEGLGQGRRAGPHVSSDDKGVLELDAIRCCVPAALEELSGGMPHLPGSVLVQWIGIGWRTS